jgi:large subunit ribosomal protein L2
MATREYKPTSPGRRGMSGREFGAITKHEPEKVLTTKLSKNAGRNSYGRITSRHRGGGAKRRYRMIDFKRDKTDVPATVAAIEYDPNRSANIALLNYADGEKRYILAPLGIRVGQRVISADTADIQVGNCMKLKGMPLGSQVHKIVRSAGGVAQLMAREGDYALLKLPSGEVRKVNVDCRATIGQLGNIEHENVNWGKAGRSRYRGRRPHVRGSAMNPVDHPHGGGEGRTTGGRNPVTPWGKCTKGMKTRHNKRTNQYIVKDRRKK